MKLFLTVFLLTLSLSLFAQKAAILNKLSEYRIDSNALVNMSNRSYKEIYAFDFNSNSTVADKEKYIVAQYDPLKPKGQQWNIISVNGKTPSSGDWNAFMKQYDADVPAFVIDDA